MQIKKKICAFLLAATIFFSPQKVLAVDSGDALTALFGTLGTFAMYNSYLQQMLDVGNNAIYQEQTFVYDKTEHGQATNLEDKKLIDDIMTRLVYQGDYILDIRSLPFRWQLNNQKEFNAACFATNVISINRGLVQELRDNEDAIAGVLAHEMTHGIKLHAAFTYAKAAAQSFGVTFLGMVSGEIRPDVVAQLADYSVAKSVITPAEYEADIGGFDLMISAGFNPGGAMASLVRMDYLARNPSAEDFSRLYGADSYDHPETLNRIKKLEEKLFEYSQGHVTVTENNEVCIDGEILLKATSTNFGKDETYDNTRERVYLIAGSLAKAFHDFSSADAWNFRYGANGRVEFLTKEKIFEPLHYAVGVAHAEKKLQELVTQAYQNRNSAILKAQQNFFEAKRKKNEFDQERMEKNSFAKEKLCERIYENADWYNDVFRPELSLKESERGFALKNLTPKQKAGLYATRGRAYGLLGQYETAFDCFQKAIAHDASFAYIYLNRAEVLRLQGKHREALIEVQKTIDLDAEAPAAYKMAGDICKELGDNEQAKSFYKLYLKLVPKADDLSDEDLKELSPKIYQEVLKQREEKFKRDKNFQEYLKKIKEKQKKT